MKYIHLTVFLHLTTIVLLFKSMKCSPLGTVNGQYESPEIDTRKFMPKVRVRRNETFQNRSISAVRGKDGQLIPQANSNDPNNFVMATKNPVSNSYEGYSPILDRPFQQLQLTPEIPYLPQQIIPFPFLQPIKPVSNQQQSTSITNRNSFCTETYCEESSNYPIDVLKGKNLEKYLDFFGEDFVENIATRFDAPEETSLCESRKKLIFPKEAVKQDNSWGFVVNHENYTQGIWIDQCEGNQKCKYESSFPNGIETHCKQNFVFRQLLSVDKNAKLSKQYFKFPSCCQCVVSQKNYFRIAPASPSNSRTRRQKEK